MLTRLPVLLTLISIALLQNCAHITMLRTEELRTVQTQVDSLSAQLSLTGEELSKQLEKQNELLRRLRADQFTRFGDLDQKISALTGNVLESQQKLADIDQKTNAITNRVSERYVDSSGTNSVGEQDAKRLFQLAYNDFMARRFDLAIQGFNDIVNQYPQTSTTEEAAYWIAESAYAQKKWKEAEDGYKTYLKQYSTGAKVCAAFYKLGKIYHDQKQEKATTLVLNKLIERCPNSDEAMAARDMLK